MREFPPEITSLLKMGEGRIWLAGGALRPGKPADYDLFFKDEKAIVEANTFLNIVGECVFKCPEGLLYTYKVNNYKVQCVTERTYKTMRELIDTFDLIPCCAATDGNVVVKHGLFDECVKDKVVKLNKITYPVSTLARLVRYAGKGFKVAPKVVEEVAQYLLEHPDANRRLYID